MGQIAARKTKWIVVSTAASAIFYIWLGFISITDYICWKCLHGPCGLQMTITTKQPVLFHFGRKIVFFFSLDLGLFLVWSHYSWWVHPLSNNFLWRWRGRILPGVRVPSVDTGRKIKSGGGPLSLNSKPVWCQKDFFSSSTLLPLPYFQAQPYEKPAPLNKQSIVTVVICTWFNGTHMPIRYIMITSNQVWHMSSYQRTFKLLKGRVPYWKLSH